MIKKNIIRSIFIIMVIVAFFQSVYASVNVEKIYLNKEKVEINVWMNYTLSASVLPTNASVSSVEWYSSDSNVKDKNSTIQRPRHAIDVYDGNTLEYLETNIILLGDGTELESIDYYEDGFFAIHYFYLGTSKPARVFKIFINLGN